MIASCKNRAIGSRTSSNRGRGSSNLVRCRRSARSSPPTASGSGPIASASDVAIPRQSPWHPSQSGGGWTLRRHLFARDSAAPPAESEAMLPSSARVGTRAAYRLGRNSKDIPSFFRGCGNQFAKSALASDIREESNVICVGRISRRADLLVVAWRLDDRLVLCLTIPCEKLR